MKKVFIFIITLLTFSNINAQPWQQLVSTTTNQLNSVYFPTPSIGYVVGNSGTILKTTDAGNTWSKQNSGGNSFDLNSVFFTNKDTGYTVGNDMLGDWIILKTSDGGNTWLKEKSGTYKDINSVYFTSANTGFVVGSMGIIFKTINSGTTWFVQDSSGSYDLNSLYFPDALTGYAVGNVGEIIKTIDGGNNWSTQNSGINDGSYLYSVYFINSKTGYAVGYGSSGAFILKTINGGTNWSRQNISSSYHLNSVYFSDSITGYAVGTAMFKTVDGGKNWVQQNSTITNGLMSVFFINDTTGYAVGNSGKIIKTLKAPLCSYSISPLDTSASSTGSSGSFYVNTTSACYWAAVSNNSWIYVTTNTSGTGNAIVYYSVAVNLGSSRAGTISLKDANGITQATFTVNQSNTSSFNNSISTSSALKAYPNPTSDKLFIEIPQPSKESILSLYNISGQQLLNQQISSPKTELDISNLQRGVYLLKFTNTNSSQVIKIIKE